MKMGVGMSASMGSKIPMGKPITNGGMAVSGLGGEKDDEVAPVGNTITG